MPQPISDIVTLWSAPFVRWMLLVNMLLLALMTYIRTGLLADAFRGVISPMDRNTFAQTETHPLAHIAGLIFRATTIGLAFYIVSCPSGRWNLAGYVVVVGLTLVWQGVQIGCALWLNWVFQWGASARLLLEHLTALLTVAALCVGGIAAVFLAWPCYKAACVAILIVGILYAVAIWGKALRYRFYGLISALYALLFTLTAVVLPSCGVVYVSRMINNYL